MAYAPPDPKRVEYQAALERAAAAEIAFLEEQERERKRQIASCYAEYLPTQIVQASKMLACNRVEDRLYLAGVPEGTICWERIGRSNGGRKKGNLYRCTAL